MAYQNGSATSSIDLLQKLCTWLVANGWTQDASASEGSGWRSHLHKGSQYVNFRASISETVWAAEHGSTNSLHMNLGTGYNAGSAWHSQAGAPQSYNAVSLGVACNCGSLLAYHFFGDSTVDNIVVVIESSAGVFHHLAWGSMVKAGSWTGGAYFSGSRSGYWSDLDPTITDKCPGTTDPQECGNIFIRADVDSVTGIWLSDCSTTKSGYQGMTVNGQAKRILTPFYSTVVLDSSIPHYQYFESYQFTTMNGLANLLPVLLYVNRDVSPGGASLLGQIPGIYRSIATDNGYGIGSTYPLGADNYTLFPNFAVKKV